jgi:uncharacterized RDD family membrane protein YckC
MNEPNDSAATTEPSGFWRRVGAFLIDVLIVGILGLAVAFTMRDTLAPLGAWGRLVGFLIALPYFAVLNSRIGGGQTLGKRLFRIKVIEVAGGELSVGKSILRSGILQIPWFLNGAAFSGATLFSFWLFPLSIAVFGIGLSILYLVIFNRPSRRSLHDIAIDSVVVRAPATNPIGPVETRRIHLIVCACLIVCSTLLPLASFRLAQGETFGPLLSIHRAVSADPAIVTVLVNRGTQITGQGELKYVDIRAQLRQNAIGDTAHAARLARRAIEADPSIRSLDVVQVTFTYGFDIGIASSWNTRSHSFAPASIESP